jgi:nicotinate phosphoribosyltransferase
MLPGGSTLFTDLYELTMLQAYLEEGFAGPAVFTLFVRRLPPQRNVMVACGLDSVLTYLEALRFTDQDIAYLRSQQRFSDRFLHSLRDFQFAGDVHAVAEGTPLFAGEPILEIIAPLPQAQLVETAVMNHIHFQTVVASKAARVVRAAQGRAVIDFGARRTHGIDAAVNAARACHIAGVEGTSNVLAGKLYGIPLAGTMAHSYVQAHDDERDAFRAFATMFPGTILLVDTYDTLEGVRRVIDLVTGANGQVTVGAIRLDSGDLVALATASRQLLDAASLRDIRIFASSSLDEYEIDRLVKAGAPIDGFGVGTSMDVSSDAPTLDIVYKLAEYDGKPRTKLAQSKPVLPGRKQVFRREENGRATADVIARFGEELEGRPLLECVMRGGRRVTDSGDLGAARARAAAELAKLPEPILSLQRAEPYPVSVSAALEEYHQRAIQASSR